MADNPASLTGPSPKEELERRLEAARERWLAACTRERPMNESLLGLNALINESEAGTNTEPDSGSGGGER